MVLTNPVSHHVRDKLPCWLQLLLFIIILVVEFRTPIERICTNVVVSKNADEEQQFLDYLRDDACLCSTEMQSIVRIDSFER
jgi:hypothetical protein